MTLSKLGIPRASDGRSKHYLYNHWRQMLSICYDRKHGTVIKRWLDFWNFVDDVDKIYNKHHGKIFCRIKSSKPFGPNNVHFVNDGFELSNTRKDLVRVKIGGKKLNVREISKLAAKKGIDISPHTIYYRAKNKKKVMDKKYSSHFKSVKLPILSKMQRKIVLLLQDQPYLTPLKTPIISALIKKKVIDGKTLKLTELGKRFTKRK